MVTQDIKNFFRLKKENKTIRDWIIRDIKNLFGQEKEHYYKSVRVGSFWSRNSIEHESNGGKYKTLSIEE